MSEEKKATKERQSKHSLRSKLQQVRKEPKKRSARFLSLEDKLPGRELKSVAEAVALVKQTATTKFDSSLELHLHLTTKKG